MYRRNWQNYINFLQDYKTKSKECFDETDNSVACPCWSELVAMKEDVASCKSKTTGLIFIV